MNMEPIVVEAEYEAPIEVVWTALTDPAQMPRWFFEPIAEFRPEVGFETRFTVRADGNDYVHDWRVAEVTPPKRMVLSWRYDGLPGDSTVTWELSETDGGTALRLTHKILEPFPQDDPAFHRETGLSGWKYFLQESLKAFLERPA